MLITSLNGLFQKGCGTVDEIMSKNTFESGMVKSSLVMALEFAMLVLNLVVVSKVIGSLLCAVTEGEESEKRFFSKIGLPICISFAGVLIIDIILLVFFDFRAILFVSDIFYLALFALMLLGLKYKFDDIKFRKIICNVLPFAYVALEAIIAAVKIVSIV